MKTLSRIGLIGFILLSASVYSQTKTKALKFDTKYYDAVNQWVAFPKAETDSTYTYGLIYIDAQAGFTFNYESKFSSTAQGLKKISNDSINESIKYRLSPKTSLVAKLTQAQITALELPASPDWLEHYKGEGVEYLKDLGYHYNHVGACQKALIPLKKAYSLDPHFKGLEFELSYAYNALGKHEKAILILDKAIANDPDNFYFYRELGFAYKNTDKIKLAEKTYKKGIKISDNDFEKSEMAVNMAQTYYELRKRKKFDIWAKLTRQYAKKGSTYAKYIDVFEDNWDGL